MVYQRPCLWARAHHQNRNEEIHEKGKEQNKNWTATKIKEKIATIDAGPVHVRIQCVSSFFPFFFTASNASIYRSSWFGGAATRRIRKVEERISVQQKRKLEPKQSRELYDQAVEEGRRSKPLSGELKKKRDVFPSTHPRHEQCDLDGEPERRVMEHWTDGDEMQCAAEQPPANVRLSFRSLLLRPLFFFRRIYMHIMNPYWCWKVDRSFLCNQEAFSQIGRRALRMHLCEWMDCSWDMQLMMHCILQYPIIHCSFVLDLQKLLCFSGWSSGRWAGK